ncbi:MAG: class I SAM-dependent methyltransferase [Planctomycetota bacterium]
MRRAHLTRYFMYESLQRHFAARPIRGAVLGVSGLDYFHPMIDCRHATVVETRYPEIDMQALPFADASFDCVISDQVIEHLPSPQRAIDESRRVLRPGGLAIHCTVFMYELHLGPRDYWRFSIDGLRTLCGAFSGIELCGSWGNRLAHLLVFLGDRFRYLSVPRSTVSVRRWIATWNEPNYPLVTWIVARK